MRERRFVDRPFHEAEVRRPVEHAPCGALGVVDRKFHRDLREAGVEGRQAWRKPIARDGLARDQLQRAALQAAIFRERQLGVRSAAQHRARFLQKHAAGFGQLDAAPNPVEQRNSVPRLQRRDRPARRRLRDVQRLSSTRDMLALGDTDENAKLLKGHGDLLALLCAGQNNPSNGLFRWI